MQFKKFAAALSLSIASTAAFAEDFRAEIGVGYVDFDVADGFAINGEIHFQEVSTSGHPLEEAGFLEHSSNVFLNYLDIEDEDVTNIGVELYLGGFYIAPSYIDSSVDDDGIFYAPIGYASTNGWRLTTTVPEEDYEFNAQFKYVTALSAGNFINLEAGYADGGDDFEDTLDLSADYYFDETFSVGAVVIDEEDTDFGLRVNKFFTGSFRAGAEFISGDAFDTITVDASLRF